MKLTVDIPTFKSDFLNPILEINTDGKSALFIDNESLYCITACNNNSIALYNTYTPFQIESPVERINLHLGKLQKGINCIKTDSNLISFAVENNSLIYKDAVLNFSIKLLENRLITVPGFNKKLIESFPADIEIHISKDVIPDIKKANDFASDTKKFYISENEGKIYFMFGDKQTSHENRIQCQVSDKYTGKIRENIYDTAFLDLIIGNKCDMLLKMNANGAIIAEIQKGKSILNYITTQLKK